MEFSEYFPIWDQLTPGQQDTLSRSLVSRSAKKGTVLHGGGTDCTGLGAKAGMFHPARWQAVQADWPEWFSQVPVEIQVEVRIL